MAPPFHVRRLEGNPIIRPAMGARMGANIQGPSLIRVPEWVPAPLGCYYLYFADHKGDHIRLAVADALEGPWRIHDPGALSLADSLYPTTRPPRPADIGPRAPRPRMAPPGTPGVPDEEQDATTPHIASPDVHVDHANRRIVMYFHGLSAWREQRTRVATSPDGLRFAVRPPLLGPSYFRVFHHAGATYAIAMPGLLYRAEEPFGPFEPGPDLFGEVNQRHTAVLLRGDTLWVVWSRVGDAPESLLLSRVPLRGDWRGWRADPPSVLLPPQMPWEGAGLPVEGSWRGAINRPVNQLRDPALFEEEGRLFLLYAVAGESGIAIAELIEAETL